VTTAAQPAIKKLDRDLIIFVVAGEHSGDLLGGKLMAQLNRDLRGRVRYLGVGGETMAAQGLATQFPLSDVAVMGPLAIAKRLPTLFNRVYRTVDAALAAEPDCVVIIDAPEFTHQIAKRIRKRAPQIPIIDYVSPSVWAWRSGRAKKMTAYVDHVMALLPFEPGVHQKLGGPPCTYVGHPLIEKQAQIAALDPSPLRERLQIRSDVPALVVLPGSRTSEVKRLMQPFGETIARLGEAGVRPELLLPVVPHLKDVIEQELMHWPRRPHLIDNEDDKFRAFKLARVALAASGTVSLELGLAGAPMVIAYKVDPLAARLRFLVNVPSIILANLVLERNVFPEFVQEACTPENLVAALRPLLATGETPERQAQLAGLAELPGRLLIPGSTPSREAARIVLQHAQTGRPKPAR
jgi:lipid-A-disaccharide synthase